MLQLSSVCATLSLLLLSVPARAADAGAATPASSGAATSAPAASATAAAVPSPAAAQPLASGTAEPAAQVGVPAAQPLPPAPEFDATGPEEEAINFKIYGDTQFRVQNHAAVHDSFATAHIDLFPTADVGKLSFLSEIFFEAGDSNEFSVDIERLQIAYLFSNWLRLRAGRTHTAFGYYNDTYHHGNLFELTTDRPYAVNFEDEGGLIGAHLVGVGIDGTFDTGAGSFRYDLETGNGRLGDVTAVALDHAEKDDKLVNLRLRWLPIDGLI